MELSTVHKILQLSCNKKTGASVSPWSQLFIRRQPLAPQVERTYILVLTNIAPEVLDALYIFTYKRFIL